MKSMSTVIHIADAPETLEEARSVIRDQQEQINKLRNEARNKDVLIRTLRQESNKYRP